MFFRIPFACLGVRMFVEFHGVLEDHSSHLSARGVFTQPGSKPEVAVGSGHVGFSSRSGPRLTATNPNLQSTALGLIDASRLTSPRICSQLHFPEGSNRRNSDRLKFRMAEQGRAGGHMMPKWRRVKNYRNLTPNILPRRQITSQTWRF